MHLKQQELYNRLHQILCIHAKFVRHVVPIYDAQVLKTRFLQLRDYDDQLLRSFLAADVRAAGSLAVLSRCGMRQSGLRGGQAASAAAAAVASHRTRGTYGQRRVAYYQLLCTVCCRRMLSSAAYVFHTSLMTFLALAPLGLYTCKLECLV